MTTPDIDPVEMDRAARQIEFISGQIKEKIGAYEKSLESSPDWMGRTRTALVGRVTNQLLPELKKLEAAVVSGVTTLRSTSTGFQEHDHTGSTGMDGAEGAAPAPTTTPTAPSTSVLAGASLNQVV